MTSEIPRLFKARFHTEPLLVRSPGRVNLIGEHTDYNEGFVLPAAVDKAIYVAIGKRLDDAIQLFSTDFKESYESSLPTVKRASKAWANYPLGVVDQLQKGGYPLSGFNLVLGGDVPIGAGMSSSAALECATVYALNELFGLGISRMDMAKMAQLAEHTFAGVQCGIMDQFASLFGKKDYAMKLDCRSLEYEYVPLEMKGIRIVLLNTNIKHSLASSAYNTRLQQCAQGVAWVQSAHPEARSLRDVSIDMLDRLVAPKDPVVYKRCRYVIEENERLLRGCKDLQRGHIEGLGEQMFRSHEGLSKDYEVSCTELDFLVAFVRNRPEVLGARMMGGGFGGCTINLVREESVEALIEAAGKAYQEQMGLEMTAYVAEIGEGTSRVDAGGTIGINS